MATNAGAGGEPARLSEAILRDMEDTIGTYNFFHACWTQERCRALLAKLRQLRAENEELRALLEPTDLRPENIKGSKSTGISMALPATEGEDYAD